MFDDNKDYRNFLSEKQQPQVIDVEKIPVGDGFTAKARLFLPSGYNETKKYPALVYV